MESVKAKAVSFWLTHCYLRRIAKRYPEYFEKQINDLKASIERRKKLLANENYVAKAPLNIVEMDRKKLEEEKEKLDSLLK